MLKLSCHIDNNNNPINMLNEGLKISLEGQVEKRCQALGRDAIYNLKKRINKLVSLIWKKFKCSLFLLLAVVLVHLVREVLLETTECFGWH